MNIRIAAVAFAALFLSACTEQDWDNALSFGNEKSEAAAPPARPAAQAARAPAVQEAQTPKVNSFCEDVAKQDSERNDFDAPTQQRVFIRSYQQCVAIFGDATK